MESLGHHIPILISLLQYLWRSILNQGGFCLPKSLGLPHRVCVCAESLGFSTQTGSSAEPDQLTTQVDGTDSQRTSSEGQNVAVSLLSLKEICSLSREGVEGSASSTSDAKTASSNQTRSKNARELRNNSTWRYRFMSIQQRVDMHLQNLAKLEGERPVLQAVFKGSSSGFIQKCLCSTAASGLLWQSMFELQATTVVDMHVGS